MKTKAKHLLVVLAVAGSMCLAAVPLSAAGEQPSEAEMMAMMQKLASPNEHHRHLGKMEGTWKGKSSMWMAPGGEPVVSEGISKNEMILGGRFLRQTFEGNFMGQPFVGIGTAGFDNALKKHIGTWMDSAGTMIMNFAGTCSDNGRVVTEISEFQDPMSGAPMKMKMVTTIVSDDEHRFEAWSVLPDGESFKSMEIVYTRQ